MKRLRLLTSWLGRPARHIRRGLLVERLEDRLTPTINDKFLSVPVDLNQLATTQDLVALTPSSQPLTDLANVVNHYGLSNIVDVAGSGVVFAGGNSNLIQIHLQPGVTVRAAAATLYSTGLYAYVSPNYIYPPNLTGRDLREGVPNDPQFASQYHHGIIDSPRAWGTTFGNSGVTVAILDDGLDITHPDLIDNVWINSGEIAGDGLDNDGNGYIDDRFGWDFVSNRNQVTPDDIVTDAHGTQTAGVLAARIDNAIGVAGLAGRVGIMPLKVVGSGPTTSLTLARAVNYAIDNGAKIINTSINIDPFVEDPTFRTAVSHAFDSGLLWVNSAGNLNLQDPARAKFENMLIVGVTDRADKKTSYSNYGWGIDISAPGGQDGDPLLTTIPGGYGGAWGSSLAAPLVAGTAALLWSANPSWTRDQVVSAILANADSLDSTNPGFLDKLGTGRLDAGESVSGGEFVTKLGRIYGLPNPGEDAHAGFDEFRLRLLGNLDPGTVSTGNFELRWAGPNNLFDDSDDTVIALGLNDNYQYGTNSIDFTLATTLERGLYRFTAKSGGLKDPFGTDVDGDGDGVEGGDLVRYFGNPIRARGQVIDASNDPTGTGSGSGGVPGAGVFPDLNGNGGFDASTFPSTVGPSAIPDDPNSSAFIDIAVSGFTRPINYLAVDVLLTHPAPADLVITLVAPWGQRVTLFANRPVPGGATAASQQFHFEDGIEESTSIAQNLIIRNLRPDQPLASLYGGPANGIWRVEVTDTTPGDSGTLISASITVGEEPLIRPNVDGGFVIGDLPGDDVIIRVLPPSGWEVEGLPPDLGKEGAFPAFIEIRLRRSSGIVGNVHEGLNGVGGFTVFIDANLNSIFDAGEQSVTSEPDGDYAFPGLPPGTYVVRILPSPGYSITGPAVHTATLTPAEPLSCGNDFSVIRDTGPVVVTPPVVTPAIRNTFVNSLSFSLSEPVNGLSLSHLRLTRDGTEISLANATLVGSGTTFTLIGFGGLATQDGNYTFSITAPGPVGEPDRTPAPIVSSWTLDTTPPTATLTPTVGPKGVVDVVALSFTSPVNGVDLSDFTLRRNGVVVSLTAVQLAGAGAPNQFTLTNLAGVATTPGEYTLTLEANGSIGDIAGNTMANAATVTWTVPQRPVRLTAVGAGEGSLPTVIAFDADGKAVRTLTPFDLSYTGGVRVATGDVNGDGTDDIIVAPGRGAGPRVKVYDGHTGLIISDFFAFEPNFRGGLFVAAGDVTGDGKVEIIVTPDKGGGPRVRILDALTTGTVADFFGIDDANFRGGARAALGDVTGDGRPDVIVAAGSGGGPRIAVFDGVAIAANQKVKPFGDFFAFEAGLRNGAFVTAADLDGDGMAEVIAGAGDGGGPRLTAFSGADLMNGQRAKLSDFFAGDLANRGGLRLAVDDLDDDGIDELLVGPGGGGSRIRVYAASDLLTAAPDTMREYDPFGNFLGGVFLG